MPTKPLSLRLLKGVLATWWWASIIGSCIFLIALLAMPSKYFDFGVRGYASDIDTSSFSVNDRAGQPLEFKFVHPVPVDLVFESYEKDELPLSQRLFVVMLFSPCFFIWFYFIKQLRDIVGTIDEGNPFAAENASRVRLIGILIFTFEMVVSLGRLTMSGYADSIARPKGFNFNGRLEFNESLLIVALAVIVLSEVFRHGTRIREEQALTV